MPELNINENLNQGNNRYLSRAIVILGEPVTPKTITWMKNRGLVKSEKAGGVLLIVLIVFFFALSSYFFLRVRM
jgi:hypothetical protein